MELSGQIKKYRGEKGWNQEALAEKAYVSRQTVSNWENGKSYPDVHSLLILSGLFGVSLDELVKGDVQTMKEEIKKDDINKFRKWSWIYTVMFIFMILIPFPLIKFLGWTGIIIFAVYTALTIAVAFKIEKLKKQDNIRTYKEISAYLEGRSLDSAEKAEEAAKAPYQQALLAIGSGALAFTVMALLTHFFG